MHARMHTHTHARTHTRMHAHAHAYITHNTDTDNAVPLQDVQAHRHS